MLASLTASPAAALAQGGGAGPPADEDSVPAVRRVNAYFANLPRYEPPCPDLDPHYIGGLVRHLGNAGVQNAGDSGNDDLPLAAESLVRFREQQERVAELREATGQAAQEMLFAALTHFHVIDGGGGVPDIAEVAASSSRRHLDWFAALWQLSSAEKELREIADAYYAAYARVFAYASPGDRARVLDWFGTRTECLQAARREVFEAIESNRRALLEVAMSAEAWDRTAVDKANELLRHYTFQWAYAWLVPEAVLSASIYRRLLAAEERAVLNTELHHLLLQAFERDPALGPGDPLPPTAEARAVRLRVSRLRAEQAALMLYEQEGVLEAGYTKKLSILSGLADAGAKAWQDLWRTGRLSEVEGTAVFDPSVHPFALLGISYKFFSSTLDAVVAPTVKDPLIQALRGVTGLDIRTGVEQGYEEYLQARSDIERRIALLRHMATDQGYDEGLAFVRALRTGDPSGQPTSLASTAPTTVRALVEDAQFVASSRGGLAHILEVLCEDPADRTALWLRAAQHELVGSARTAYLRVAADRFEDVENPDLPMDQEALLGLLGEDVPERPGSVSEFIVANTDKMLAALPIVGQVRYLVSDLLPDLRYAIGYLKGNVIAQDAYLRQLVAMQEWAGQVMTGLERTGFRLDALGATHPAVYELHVSLLANSSEWASAYRRIREHEWERIRLYLHADAQDAGGRLTPDGQILLAAAQTGAEMELSSLATQAAWPKFQYHALTVNYAAAAEQLRQLQEIENARRAVFGIGPEVDFSVHVSRLESEALRSELVSVYEELYYKGLQEAAVSMVSTGLTNSLLTRLIGRQATGQSVNLLEELGETFNPWIPKLSASGAWSTLKGGLGDAIKAGVSQSVNRNQERLFGATFFTQEEIDKAVDILWDVGTTVAEDVTKETAAHLAESSVHWYADTEEYERLVEQARRAREVLDRQYETSGRRVLQQLEEIARAGGPEAADVTSEEVERRLAEEASQEGTLVARLRYQLATAELERAVERRERIQQRLNNVLGWIPLGQELKRRALAAAHTAAGGRAGNVALVHSAAEARTRLALGVHSLEDLRLLAEPATPDRPGFGGQVLTQQLDIDLVRGALESSSKRAKTEAERTEIDAIARAIDDRRIATIDRLLAEFMDQPGNATSVVAIIQGGAAKGNPEYQGIHADIDFTVFVDPDANVDQAGLKSRLLAHFREAGYPLAESAERPSSMDSEAFVQPWGRFDAAVEDRVAILEDVQEKRADPTRFYSEAGTKWFLNNVRYSGKPLWRRGDADTRWEPIEPGEGHGLAIDMARYMGFLTDPHYGPEALAGMNQAERRAALGSVLKKTKYYIRLIDAYEIAHSDGDVTGNALYNERADRVGGTGRDASYHWQIYRDLEQLSEAEREGRTRTVFEEGDLEMVRWMAEMKLKGENPSPWNVFRKDGLDDAQAMAAAERMLARMRELAPRILAATGAVWEDAHGRALGSADDETRKRGFNEIARMASTMRNVLDLDDYGASALMVPPDAAGDPATRRARHEAAIRASMAEVTARRRALEADAHAIAAAQPPEDLLGEETKARVAEALDDRDSRLAELEVEEESRMLLWFRYLFSLTTPLAR